MRAPLNRPPTLNANLHTVTRFASPFLVLSPALAGEYLSALHDAGFEVRGCDYSGELIEFGTAKGVPGLAVGPVDVIAGSKERFDLIYLHHVFEHVGRPLPTLKSIQRLLKPNGRLLIIVPDLGRVHLYLRAKSDPMKFIHVAHKYNYTLACFEQLARMTRFEARLFEPTDAPTAWSDAPELWVELTRAASQTRGRLNRSEFKGAEMLRYLKRTEANFLARIAKKLAKSA
jgi:SAM-dependent methyltransferase